MKVEENIFEFITVELIVFVNICGLTDFISCNRLDYLNSAFIIKGKRRCAYLADAAAGGQTDGEKGADDDGNDNCEGHHPAQRVRPFRELVTLHVRVLDPREDHDKLRGKVLI